MTIATARTRPIRTALAALLLALAALPAQAEEDAYACPGSLLSIVPATSPLAPRICAVAREIEPRFAELGLTMDRAVTVYPADEVCQLPPGCLAFLSTGTNELHILSTEVLAEAGDQLGSFHSLPPQTMFDSLIVHELTHAYLDQTGQPSEVSRLAHEYLAYAMQLDFMPDATRERVLSRTTVSRDVVIADFNEELLGFHPLRFAVFAWLHFSAEPDRREAVARILDGRTRFISLRE